MDFTGLSFPFCAAFTLIKEIWNPYSYPHAGQMCRFLPRLYGFYLRRNPHILHCSLFVGSDALTFPFAAPRATASMISAAFFLPFTAA